MFLSRQKELLRWNSVKDLKTGRLTKIYLDGSYVITEVLVRKETRESKSENGDVTAGAEAAAMLFEDEGMTMS